MTTPIRFAKGILAALLLAAPQAAVAIEGEECPKWFPDFRCDRQGRWDNFVMPMSMPYLFEEPFVTTGVQGVGIYHEYPGDSAFEGGHLWVVALQARVAITDKLAFIATKDGVAFHRPDTPLISDTDGIFDIAAGFKYALIEKPEWNFIFTPALRFDIPVGQNRVYSGNGDGVIIPSFSWAWGWEKFNTIGNFGARAPFNTNKESSSLFWNLHLSYALWKHFVPLVEFNGMHWTGGGDGSRKLELSGVPGNPNVPLDVVQVVQGTGGFEGVDVVNLGSRDVTGNNIVTFAVGARFPITKNITFGGSWEFPMTGRRDIYRQRATMALQLEF